MCKETLGLFKLQDGCLCIPFSHVNVGFVLEDVIGIWSEEAGASCSNNEAIVLCHGYVFYNVVKLVLCWYESTAEANNEDLIVFVYELL